VDIHVNIVSVNPDERVNATAVAIKGFEHGCGAHSDDLLPSVEQLPEIERKVCLEDTG